MPINLERILRRVQTNDESSGLPCVALVLTKTD